MIICCGEALIDMVRIQVPPAGEGFLPLPGGSPYNTAIAIGRLGAPVSFLGRFSTDFFGDALVSRLSENNVSCNLITRCERHSTLAFVKLEQGKEPQYVFYTEESADRSFSTEDLPPSLPPETSCILFGSISMTMEPVASTIETLIFRAVKDVKRPVISFDPNIRPFMIRDKAAYIKSFEKWAAASVIVKISAADLEFIYPGLAPDQALRKINAMGPALVIGTMGREGAAALLRRDDAGLVRADARAIPVTVADTIGAGDTFHGAFLSWLEHKGKMSRPAIMNMSEAELRDALFFANKAAAIVCSRRGADPPALQEVEDFAP